LGARGNRHASKHYAAARLPIRKMRRPTGDAALTGSMFGARRFFIGHPGALKKAGDIPTAFGHDYAGVANA
jgi:hypothetical protein